MGHINVRAQSGGTRNVAIIAGQGLGASQIEIGLENTVYVLLLEDLTTKIVLCLSVITHR